MPYSFDKKKINNRELDRRIKLTDKQREEIKTLYFERGQNTFRGLARLYNVDRQTIKFIVFPDLYKEYLENRSKHEIWRKYYTKEKHRVYVKKHRDYKKKLSKKGLL